MNTVKRGMASNWRHERQSSAADMSAIADLNIPDGGVYPYRPCPQDFRAVYLELGRQATQSHYRTNWRVICRWIEESGGMELCMEQQARRHPGRTSLQGGAAHRAKRYIMGRTLGGVK